MALFTVFVHISYPLSGFFSSDDYIAIGADCEELGAQVEEYILYSEY